MLKNHEPYDESINDPSPFGRGLGSQEVWFFAGESGGEGEENEEPEEEQEVNAATVILDTLSERLTDLMKKKMGNP